MSFTVDDFEDLLRLLYERPDWRNRLREVILPPELFELPRIANELVEVNRAERERVAGLEAEQQATRQEVREGFKQTNARIERIEGELSEFRAETDARFDQVDERFNRVDARFDGMDKRFDRMDERLGHVDARGRRTTDSLAVLKGSSMEERYRGRAVAYFSELVAEPVAFTTAEFDAFTGAELAAGRLLPAEARRLGRADLLVRGSVAGEPKYLVVEVSWALNEEGVERAADRAGLLRKAGYDAQGVVAGWRIQPAALQLAERIGVARMIERELDGEDPTGGEDDAG